MPRSAAAATAIVVLACLGPLRQAAGQDTHIRGFTDVTFNASDRAGASTNFALGQFDLYITSALAEPTPASSMATTTKFRFMRGP